MENFNLFQTKLTNGFFADRQRINAETTLQRVHERFRETGRFEVLKCKKTE